MACENNIFNLNFESLHPIMHVNTGNSFIGSTCHLTNQCKEFVCKYIVEMLQNFFIAARKKQENFPGFYL